MRAYPIILLLLLFITGCSTTDYRQGAGAEYALVHTGIQGVSIEFLNTAPPPKVFESQDFPIVVKYHNQGASDVKDGRIYLTYDHNLIEIKDGENPATFDVTGKSMTNLKGDLDLAIFQAKAIKPINRKSQATQITATACYKYQTNAVFSICVDTDQNGIKMREKVCTVQPYAQQSQGAPVAVQSVTEDVAYDGGDTSKIKMQFTIQVAKVNSGTLVRETVSSDRLCAADFGKVSQPLNQVLVRASLSGSALHCESDGLLELNKGSTIVCQTTQPIDATLPTYVAPLAVTLDYGYIDTSFPVSIMISTDPFQK